MEVPFIVTDSEMLKDTSSNTLQNQSLHTLPEVPLDRSVLENITSPQNLQLSDCPARSDLKSIILLNIIESTSPTKNLF